MSKHFVDVDVLAGIRNCIYDIDWDRDSKHSRKMMEEINSLVEKIASGNYQLGWYEGYSEAQEQAMKNDIKNGYLSK